MYSMQNTSKANNKEGWPSCSRDIEYGLIKMS